MRRTREHRNDRESHSRQLERVFVPLGQRRPCTFLREPILARGRRVHDRAQVDVRVLVPLVLVGSDRLRKRRDRVRVLLQAILQACSDGWIHLLALQKLLGVRPRAGHVVPQQLDGDEAEPPEVGAVAVRVRLERRDTELVADVGMQRGGR
ncbi:hypothetical protein EUGRSUZ_D01177 [Eucalyptus grandis]|uniref:Uncharacterized protein n=2 Tax=Eucalyptus grandis TaxID=71139 RepID=A0ACC3L782_EUCGR|nr:hypothetical protein EUGRSUZ_D01177 [Eucalyptus grandis]